MSKKELSKQELEWQTTEDVATIERYQKILNDKERLARAMKKAEEQITNLKERAAALGKSLTGLKK
jgi:hypothetical protein